MPIDKNVVSEFFKKLEANGGYDPPRPTVNNINTNDAEMEAYLNKNLGRNSVQSLGAPIIAAGNRLFPGTTETPQGPERVDLGVHPVPARQDQILSMLLGPKENWDERTRQAANTYFARPAEDIGVRMQDTLGLGFDTMNALNVIPEALTIARRIMPNAAKSITNMINKPTKPKPPSASAPGTASTHRPPTKSSGGYIGRPMGTRKFTETEKSKFMKPIRNLKSNKPAQKLLMEKGSITNMEKEDTALKRIGIPKWSFNRESPIQRRMMQQFYDSIKNNGGSI